MHDKLKFRIPFIQNYRCNNYFLAGLYYNELLFIANARPLGNQVTPEITIAQSFTHTWIITSMTLVQMRG
jgi:hypothetical protein